MNCCPRSAVSNHVVGLLVLGGLCVGLLTSQGAPTIITTVPPNTATAPAVFTFSEAMNTSATTIMFMYGPTLLTTTPVWSGSSTVLTCTPAAAWPAGQTIYWFANGASALGAPLGGTTFGMFTGPGGSTGCDTNAAMLSFTVSKGWMYSQTSASAPTSNAASPYCFLACMSLPCPRDATNVSLQVPSGPTENLMLSPIPGHLTLPDCGYTDQTAFEAAYPPGDYHFNIQAVSSNQPVTVNLPPDLTQPPAPRLTNYAAAQAINPAQPFVLAWDSFAGGTASDCIYVEIYGGVFKTRALGETGALNGTATAVVIPAGTFQPNSQYSGCVTFYHYKLLTNGTSYVSLAYRASTTEFDLATTSGSAYRPVITNAGWAAAGTFSFDVACPINQALVAECRTNLSVGQWVTLCSTNSATQRVRFTDPAAGARARSFYRVRTGS